MLKIRKVISANSKQACRRLLTQSPIVNVLVLGDLYSPLFDASDVYCAVENQNIVGVCSIYRAFSTPSLVFSSAKPEVKSALIAHALTETTNEFISLCQPNEIHLLEEYSDVLRNHPEHQMIAYKLTNIENDLVEAARVRKGELELLKRFYAEHHAEAWVPIQFKVGPYYRVKRDGKIVSAAGVHIVTPQIAQLGNIITDEAFRNRGFATACTTALVTDLASTGRVISLFVRTMNDSAIRMYEKLGFVKKRDIAFLIMRKR